ncbi:hypothetical protein AMTR_s00006p00195140 [Amborella trichopoda]|uniref:Uncharacterized protein n=2 Tax=Amborella trichopoda TaxID=13333 RepID=W1PDC8_AMBTC|nr:hypothetical protein AMTR_s00006p00195140 [Amborella trichopoda]
MRPEEEDKDDAELRSYMHYLFAEVEEGRSQKLTLDRSQREVNLPLCKRFHETFEMEDSCTLFEATHISVPRVELPCGNETLTTLDFRTSLETLKFKSLQLKARKGPVMKENNPAWSNAAKMTAESREKKRGLGGVAKG